MKRSTLCLLSLIIASPVFGADLSWEQIRADSKFHATFPMIGFGDVAVSVDQLCIDGEKIRPVLPYRDVCIRWEDSYGEAIPACKEYRRVRLETPIHYDAIECIDWQYGENAVCTEYQTIHKVHKLTYAVEVYDAREWGSESGSNQPLFVKSFTIPTCN